MDPAFQSHRRWRSNNAMPVTPAKVLREAAKAEVAREMSRARVMADLDQSEVAAACGVPRTVPSVWESKDGTKSPLVADLHNMPSPVALALLRQAAHKHGHEVAPATEGDLDVSSVYALHRVLKECADVQLRHAQALADGELSPAELADIEREAQEAASALQQLAASARKLRAKHLRDVTKK